jgi:hypothetical protein
VAVADINGDGYADLIVAAGFGGGPRVAVFDGRSVFGELKRLMPDFFAFESGLRNGAFIAAGDVSGDGKADLVFGGGPGGAPRIRVANSTLLIVAPSFTNLDEVPDAQLGNFFGGDTASRGGARIVLKNLDNDDHADILVGSGQDNGSRLTTYFGASLPRDGTPNIGLNLEVYPGYQGGIFVG